MIKTKSGTSEGMGLEGGRWNWEGLTRSLGTWVLTILYTLPEVWSISLKQNSTASGYCLLNPLISPQQWFSAKVDYHPPPHPGDMWPYLETCLVVTNGGQCYRDLAGRGQECWWTSHSAQNIPPHNKELFGPKCNGAKFEKYHSFRIRNVFPLPSILKEMKLHFENHEKQKWYQMVTSFTILFMYIIIFRK